LKVADIQVEFIDSMGNDRRVVDAARASFNSSEESYSKEREKSLIEFLARGMMSKEYDLVIKEIAKETDIEKIKHLVSSLDKEKHFAPFTHCMLTFRVTAPLFLARQLWKSHVGGHLSESVIGDGWSEVSRRYVDSEPDFYIPSIFRAKSDNVKQGSSATETVERIDVDVSPKDVVVSSTIQTVLAYEELLANNVCPEQARMGLSQNMMTTWVWTGSLLFFSRICKLRLDSHAQKENEEIAKPIYGKLLELFPVSTQALLGNINE